MAITFNEKENEMIIELPNSEAKIESQHIGIKDRTVGSYYMSDMQSFVIDFLCDLEGKYYLDVALIHRNAKVIIKKLQEKQLNYYFKSKLVFQVNSLKYFEYLLDDGVYFYDMGTPTINSQNKYIKLNNDDNIVDNFRLLCLGDLVHIHFKRLTNDSYIVYLAPRSDFDEFIESGIKGWSK